MDRGQIQGDAFISLLHSQVGKVRHGVRDFT